MPKKEMPGKGEKGRRWAGVNDGGSALGRREKIESLIIAWLFSFHVQYPPNAQAHKAGSFLTDENTH